MNINGGKRKYFKVHYKMFSPGNIINATEILYNFSSVDLHTDLKLLNFATT